MVEREIFCGKESKVTRNVESKMATAKPAWQRRGAVSCDSLLMRRWGQLRIAHAHFDPILRRSCAQLTVDRRGAHAQKSPLRIDLALIGTNK